MSVVVTAIALSPLVLGSMSRSTVATTPAPAQTAAVAPANLSTNVAITASEFKFSPTSIEVPVGQQVTFSLTNTGVVQHDFTAQNAGFSLTANPGQTATGQFTFAKAGVFQFFVLDSGSQGRRDAGHAHGSGSDRCASHRAASKTIK